MPRPGAVQDAVSDILAGRAPLPRSGLSGLPGARPRPRGRQCADPVP